MEKLLLNEEIIDIVKRETVLAMRYFAVVNFACLPCDEFAEKKSWYAYFRNIDSEMLYGYRSYNAQWRT